MIFKKGLGIAIVAILPLFGFAQEGLFDKSEILKIKISGDIKELMNDRGDDPEYHPVSISYFTTGMSRESVELKARTRGNFRRKSSNCTYPPIMLNFDKDGESTLNSIFSGQNLLKLVTPCQQDKFVVREYMLYKVYNLFTDFSFKARLVQMTLEDTQSGKEEKPLFGILIENEDKMAERLEMTVSKQLGLRPERTDPENFHKMAVFQYLIGNTDWSTQYRHNIKLVAKDSMDMPIAVPYDFDLAGIVNSPYAKPAPELDLIAVQERRYRGYCQETMLPFESVFKEFNDKKTDLYNLYSSDPVLDQGYKGWVGRYMEKFYKTINDPKKSKRAFQYPCDKNGTGNVVIKGLGR